MNQKGTIETIRERNIRIALSDADMETISEVAGRVGMTVGELLQNFIGDVVYGTQRNGADECMYANQWLDRCFSMDIYQNSTFLRFLLDYNNSYDVEAVITYWQKIKDCENGTDESDRKMYLEYQELLDDIYADFLEQISVTKKPTINDSMNEVMKWWNERQLPND